MRRRSSQLRILFDLMMFIPMSSSTGCMLSIFLHSYVYCLVRHLASPDKFRFTWSVTLMPSNWYCYFGSCRCYANAEGFSRNIFVIFCDILFLSYACDLQVYSFQLFRVGFDGLAHFIHDLRPGFRPCSELIIRLLVWLFLGAPRFGNQLHGL